MDTRTDARFPLTRPLPPWPGVLPLSEAASVLGLKADTLQKRISRRQQPSLLRGGRRQVVLLPHQWATWAVSYRPAAPARTRTEGESAAPHHRRTDAGTSLERELLDRLAALEVRVAELEARPAGLLPADSPADRLPVGEPWWRRVLAWLGTPPALAAPRAPLPQNR